MVLWLQTLSYSRPSRIEGSLTTLGQLLLFLQREQAQDTYQQTVSPALPQTSAATKHSIPIPTNHCWRTKTDGNVGNNSTKAKLSAHLSNIQQRKSNATKKKAAVCFQVGHSPCDPPMKSWQTVVCKYLAQSFQNWKAKARNRPRPQKCYLATNAAQEIQNKYHMRGKKQTKQSPILMQLEQK